ncbi:acyl--CoA ligase [Dongia sedimenti]|uniref:Acyl--CoA ligase n=1 Tax=Dongia sedimenti TaxID=3064282 RepID=A0ABU0YIQ7_9PROT|nr:acyl--CoA ligase [Rhodospirillaceae bacterium R-7]
MSEVTTVAALLRQGDPNADAIGAPERRTMTRGELVTLVDQVGGALRAIGIGPQDAVAIVMPNGPEMASAFLAVASSATAAPLNAAYREDEFDFYLDDLQAKALIILGGAESPARAVAARRGIRLIELTPDLNGPAGAFTLSVPFADAGPMQPNPDDVALVLHTSGTTSRPKIVPLRQRNLAASARHIAQTLALTPADRSLVIMPLFHIHGLIGALLSSMYAGASVHCPPGFNALKFFGWLDEAKATWYSAVPTMHQTILARAERNAEILARRKLRFIRSSSASLPPPVMKALEQTFGCPVIESYGMTEATHQMASNPLPPAPRKPGTVGIAAGPEVAIMDNDGTLLPRGQTGEIVIRGPNVTAGYANNPKANAEAFTHGWFRTGDQGVMDADGYLSLTGRLKEIINRGGEKIAPREVDDVIMEHPAVAQVVTFGMPHEKLGEEVAAAVVLKEGQSVGEKELRDFVAGKLADFKVPKKILFLPEIPKGATGKLQRIGLAAKLGLG